MFVRNLNAPLPVDTQLKSNVQKEIFVTLEISFIWALSLYKTNFSPRQSNRSHPYQKPNTQNVGAFGSMWNIGRALSGNVSVLAGTTHNLKIFRRSLNLWIWRKVMWFKFSISEQYFFKWQSKNVRLCTSLIFVWRIWLINSKIIENIWKYFHRCG